MYASLNFDGDLQTRSSNFTFIVERCVSYPYVDSLNTHLVFNSRTCMHHMFSLCLGLYFKTQVERTYNLIEYNYIT